MHHRPDGPEHSIDDPWRGAGIAGSTLAYWLSRAGYDPTLIERAPAPRLGGYLVDFPGAGFEVAERMGIVPQVRERGT